MKSFNHTGGGKTSLRVNFDDKDDDYDDDSYGNSDDEIFQVI